MVTVPFAEVGPDPSVSLFSWMSPVAVIAIVFVEILVSVALIRPFMT
jgi:hypothetical protein